MTNKNLPIISATTEEEFKKIKEVISPLQKEEYTPIIKAENWCGYVACEIENSHAAALTITLPKTVSSIENSVEYITCYCADTQYMFKIKKSNLCDKQIINYKFV